MIWRDCHSRFSLSYFWVRSPEKFKHIIFYKESLTYNHENVTDLVHYEKGWKSFMPNLPKLPFFRMNKAQGYFGAKARDFNYMHSNTSVRPPMSIFHQQSHTSLKYCLNVIYDSGQKLGSLRWEIGASLIRYRMNTPSKQLWKINKLRFTKICWKS